MTPTYPTEAIKGSIGIGTSDQVQIDGNDFGPLCTHVDITPECNNNTECHPSYRCHQTGKVCVRLNSADCNSNSATNPCWCYTHSDCSEDEMCSGTGRCVIPVIEVRNEMESDEAEFRVNSESCTARDTSSVDMYATSPWGRVKDILRFHGLCSQRNWWEYNRTMSTSQGGSIGTTPGVCNLVPPAPSDSCQLDTGTSSQRWRFTKSRTIDQTATGGIFQQRVLRQEPHTCDRDYSYFEGMTSCVGGFNQAWWKHLNSTVNPDIIIFDLTTPQHTLGRSSLYKTYSRTTTQDIATRIGVMKHVNNPRFGFLGSREGATKTYTSYGDFGFKMCSSIRSCDPQPFTLYGYTIKERLIQREGVGQAIRPVGDTFKCGAYGYYDEASLDCVLDLAVVPLYRWVNLS